MSHPFFCGFQLWNDLEEIQSQAQEGEGMGPAPLWDMADNSQKSAGILFA